MNRRGFLSALIGVVFATQVKLTPKEKIIPRPFMGYKGTEFFETGIIYAPYIPLL